MEWRLELFDIRPSLWKLIEEFVPESERPEIKEALGEGLVEETLDLQNEVTVDNFVIFLTSLKLYLTTFDEEVISNV